MLSGPKATVKRARQLRRSMTPPEVILWHRLRRKPGDFKFRRQHPAGQYVLDFFCSEAKLAIEIDGIAHGMGNQAARDEVRDRWLETCDVATLRIPAGAIARSADEVVEWIVSNCIERCNPLHQPLAGPPPRPGKETL